MIKTEIVVLLYTLFIVEIKTGKMPNNIGPTVNNMLKDIVENKKSRYKRKRERKKNSVLVLYFLFVSIQSNMSNFDNDHEIDSSLHLQIVGTLR